MESEPCKVCLEILLLEPDPERRERHTSVLAAAGLTTRTVGDSAAVLEACSDGAPAVLVLPADLADAPELVRQVREHAGGHDTALVLVTRPGHDQHEPLAAEMGAALVRDSDWPALLFHSGRALGLQDQRRSWGTGERRLDALVDAFPDMIFLLDRDGVITEQSGRTDSCIDGRPVNLESQPLDQALPPEAAERARKHLRDLFLTGEMQTFEHHRDEHYFETRLTLQSDGLALAIVRDITVRKEAEAKIHRLAFQDQLTGLPNREHFTRSLRAAIPRATERREQFAVLYIDLDRFKRINDTFGHGIGDALLRSVAQRLQSCVRQSPGNTRYSRFEPDGTIVARLSGDEFVVLLSGFTEEAAVATVAARIQAALSAPCVYDRHRFVITPSIGIALFPQDGQSASALLSSADAAMYRAKSEGRNAYCFYSQSMLNRSLERLDLENDLRMAARRDQLCLVYQPKVDLKTWSIVGVEALLRWKHPQRSWVSPTEFIPVAEETGLIVSLGEWVLQKACAQIRAWRTRGLDLRVAINVSSEQFRVGDFANRVMRTIEHTRTPADRLELEITESLLMRNVEDTVAALNTIRDVGIRLSVDDFGTGYSSLSYLKEFPLHSLKIDRSFVRDLETSKGDAAICAAILAMAKELGLQVIAEGVETVPQLEFLRGHACDEIQGFIFAEPMSPRELEALVRKQASHTDPDSANRRRR